MRFSSKVFVAVATVASPAYADNGQVQRGPVPGWVTPSELLPVPEGASGLVFVRRQDTLIHLDDKGQQAYAGYRMRMLHPNALQLGNLALAWNPSAGAPTVHTIQIHRDGHVIDVLKGASFEILRRENQLETASLDGVLTAVLRVADLRVGDELEVEATVRSSDPTLGATDAGVLALTSETSPGRYRLGLSWTEGQEPHLKMTPIMASTAKRRARGVDFLFDNPPMLKVPNDAPARYAWQRVVEFSDFSDWAAISRHFGPLFTKAATLGPGSPLKAEARKIAAAHSTPLARASAALKLVQQEVRYIYVGLDGGNLTPATAQETWNRRYGDCKGKTALLLALLRELGIDAEPVLVSNTGADDGLDERLPNVQMFDHVLVRARIDGTQYWLDGTLPPVAAPNTAPVTPYRWTLPLTAKGSSIEPLQWRPQQIPDEITMFEIDAREGFDQPARITSTAIVRGIQGLKQQVELSAYTPTQLLEAFRQELIGDTWQVVDDVRWQYDPKAQASILTISGTGTIDWDSDDDGSKSLALPGGGFSPPERRVRPAEQDQDAPYYNKPDFDCRVTTVRLPKSTRPEQWSFNSSFDTQIFGQTYHRVFELRDGAIRMIRGTRVDQQEIDSALATRDNMRIAAFDNSKAVISYDPDKKQAAAKSVWHVPATYEGDWTAANVPCLASAPAL